MSELITNTTSPPEEQNMSKIELLLFWLSFIIGNILVWLPKPLNSLLSALFNIANIHEMDAFILFINHILSMISIMIVIIIGMPKAIKILKNFKNSDKDSHKNEEFKQ